MRTRNVFLKEAAEGQGAIDSVGGQPHRRTKPMLIFDGDCGFCTSSAEWIGRRLGDRADVVPGQRIDPAPYGLRPEDLALAAWWIDAAGRPHRGHRAVGQALRTCGGWSQVLSWPCLVPPFSWAASVVYGLVAHFRHRLPGGTPACRVNPPPR